jgi:hypothetical protein
MSTHSKSVTQVTGDCAKVGTGAHYSSEREIGWVIAQELDPMNHYLHRVEVYYLAPAGLSIASLTGYLLGRVLGRLLQLASLKLTQGLPHLVLGERLDCGRPGYHLTGQVVGRGLDAKACGGEVLLGLHFNEPGKPGSPAEQEDQESRREGIQSPGMADCPDAQPAAHILDDIMRANTSRFVYQHRADQP